MENQKIIVSIEQIQKVIEAQQMLLQEMKNVMNEPEIPTKSDIEVSTTEEKKSNIEHTEENKEETIEENKEMREETKEEKIDGTNKETMGKSSTMKENKLDDIVIDGMKSIESYVEELKDDLCKYAQDISGKIIEALKSFREDLTQRTKTHKEVEKSKELEPKDIVIRQEREIKKVQDTIQKNTWNIVIRR